ncbi:MAG: oxidoreductase [Actinomycetota bacterium]|nr:oxidoreductase [Actinomycetota bacterium]
MGLGDRIRGFFSKKSNPELRGLAVFAAERKGVEGYVEPQTATSPTTLLLVDRDGDHQRGAVKDPRDAIEFCERLAIPVYDAAVMGYPRRMRDFDRRKNAPSADVDAQIAELEKSLAESDPNVPDE